MAEGLNAEIGPVTSADELRDVQRFKYDVYVAEMGRYGAIADHGNRLLVEVDDATSHIYQARVDGALVGTMRFSWGGDGGIGERQIAQYDLAPFLAAMPLDQMVVSERFMIDPAYRGTPLLLQMFRVYMAFVNARRIQMVFGDCEPHLLNIYLAMGFRTYTERNVNSAETGFLIPLVIVAEDLDYMRAVRSPLVKALRDFGDEARVPAGLDALLAGGEAVISQKMLDPDAYWAAISTAAEAAGALQRGMFVGMNPAEVRACLDKSVTIECRPGDRVIKRGNVAKNMNMVLSGVFEVRDGEAVVARLGPGDVFGEMAFFLKQPRALDVCAVSEGARIVSFSERTFRTLIAGNSEAAVKLMQNIVVMLCGRLQAANVGTRI
jgi:hypothetical protein